MNVDWGTVLQALAIGLPTLALGVMGYSVARKKDIAQTESGGVDQIIKGMNLLIDQLQERDGVSREELRLTLIRLAECHAERDAKTLQIARLQRQYGVNGGT